MPIKTMNNNNNNSNEKKRIRFDRRVKVRNIRSHLDYTFDERSSVWYTVEEYRSFKLVEINDNLSSRSLLKREKIQQKRIDDVRYLLLRAQEVQRNLARNGLSSGRCYSNSEDYSEWLAQFYEHHSEPCAIAAHQRGVQVQNDRETIQIRREASSMVLKDDSSIFNNLTAMMLPANASNDGGISKSIKRNLQEILYQNFDWTKHHNDSSKSSKSRLETATIATLMSSPNHSQKRWSANLSRDGGVLSSSKSKDLPLKPHLRHIILTPPLLKAANAA